VGAIQGICADEEIEVYIVVALRSGTTKPPLTNALAGSAETLSGFFQQNRREPDSGTPA
jgi:hypothetical protein